MRKFYKVTEDAPEQCTLTPVDAGYIDGYLFGDRLLEGCIFKITVTDQNKLVAEVTPDCASYFEGLAKNKWLTAAVKCAEDNDIFGGLDWIQNKINDEVVLYDTERPWDDQQAHFRAEPTFADGYVPKQPPQVVAAPVSTGTPVKKLTGVDLIARLKSKVQS